MVRKYSYHLSSELSDAQIQDASWNRFSFDKIRHENTYDRVCSPLEWIGSWTVLSKAPFLRSFPATTIHAIHLSPKLRWFPIGIVLGKTIESSQKCLWIESFHKTWFLHQKPDVGQSKIFAEFSCERYSCDSFNSKAEVVSDRYSTWENYREIPEMFVHREFRPNRILTLTAHEILRISTPGFFSSASKLQPIRGNSEFCCEYGTDDFQNMEIAFSSLDHRAIIRTGLHTLPMKWNRSDHDPGRPKGNW